MCKQEHGLTRFHRFGLATLNPKPPNPKPFREIQTGPPGPSNQGVFAPTRGRCLKMGSRPGPDT